MAGNARDIQMRESKDTISGLNELIKTLQQTVKTANAREAALCQERDNLKEQMDYLARRLFGASSERSKCDAPGQLNLFNETETAEDPVATLSEEALPSWKESEAKPRKRRAANEEHLRDLPIKQVFLDIPEEECICGVCGILMEIIGMEFVRRELKFIPAKVEIIEYCSVNYGCPRCCKEAVLPQIKKGKGGRAHRTHRTTSIFTVAWIIYQKYFNGVFLYRQKRDWKQYGANISRATFASWIIASAQNLLTPIYAYFRKKLLARSPTMMDETPVQVLREPGRRVQTQSYMWLFRSGEDKGPSIILYKYIPTRAGDDAVEFLEGYSGCLMYDGYSSYDEVPDAKRTTCWAHIRQCLIDATPKGEQLNCTQPSAREVMYVNCLFEMEDKIRKRHVGDYKAIQKVRLGKGEPTIDEFLSWLGQQKPTRGSWLDKATTYIQNREPYLSRYLEDGRRSFSNNLSENAICPFIARREGRLLSDTPARAETSAVIYTMVENAKANEVNAYQYLKLLLEKQPGNRMPGEELERFALWNPEVRAFLDSRVTDEPENG